MPSFDDSYEFYDSRRASQLDDSFYSLRSGIDNSPLTQPTDLHFSPFTFSIPSPTEHSLRNEVEDDMRFSTFMSMSRPLLLEDSHSGSPPEFQSNNVSLFDYSNPSDRLNNLSFRQKNGLGFHLGQEITGLKTMETARPCGGPSSCLPPEGILQALPDSSPAYLTMSDPFDNSGNYYMVLNGLTQNNILAVQEPLCTQVLPFSAILNPSLPTGKCDEELSAGSAFASSSYSITSSLSLVEHLANLPGVVADINMFDQASTSNNLCVRPQDLIASGDLLLEEPKIASSVKVEETPDLFSTETACTTSSSPIQDSQLHWRPESSRSPPDAIDQCILQVSPDHPFQREEKLGQNISHTLDFSGISNGFSSILSRHSLGYCCTPIASDVVEPVEKPTHGESFSKPRKRLSDRTNIPGSRNPASVLEMFDSVIPRDIALENTHEGVTGKDVAQKAKFFMMMHPGDRLSDELLFTFAGRLSVTGEAIQGYRCYVVGCTKTTKRKDHMGDHIRTHLGEKPFQCIVCGLGFIRNNDCQRHENNHRPDKKFICDCQAAFSRRDLFVRHQKTACVLTAVGSGVSSRRPRKYAKTSGYGRDVLPDGDDLNDFDYVPRKEEVGV